MRKPSEVLCEVTKEQISSQGGTVVFRNYVTENMHVVGVETSGEEAGFTL